VLINAKTLDGFTLQSLDGEIGKVKEFYFDDQHWAIRYLVAETGDWLLGRQVLISPYALGAITTEKQHISVHLTKKQIEDSPLLTSDKPVSRQFELDYYGFYGWPTYWGGPYMWGYSPYLMRSQGKQTNTNSGGKAWNPHLRSTHSVSGYHLQAVDGEIGHVQDFIIDDETWAIRYLIIDTKNWWPGKKVLISPRWAERVSWDESKVFVNLSRNAIRQSPEYKADSIPTRVYETGLHGHYDRPGYWVEELAAKEHSH